MAEWVVLELSQKAEGEDPDIIKQSIKHMLRDAEIYIPVSVTKVGADRVINYLVEGYAFIKRAHADDRYYRLEGSRYVQSVITNIGRANGRPVRQLALAYDKDIEKFRSQIHAEENQGIGVGDLVVVTSGPYRQITATVIEDIAEREEVCVHIKLRSKEDIVKLPRSFLRLVQRASKSPYLERAEGLRAWFNTAKPFLLADASRFTRVLAEYDAFVRLSLLKARHDRLDVFHGFSTTVLDLEPIRRRHSLYENLLTYTAARAVASPPLSVTVLGEHERTFGRLVMWDARWKSLVPTVVTLHSFQSRAYSPPLDSIQAQYTSLAWYDDVFERLGGLQNELDAIEGSMSMGGDSVDTILVDGHNLAVRCALVPGLDTLKDSKGRYTGAIVGFLRSLGSFRKKYPGAEIVVAWDGSSQRRRGMFADYKANRRSHVVGVEITNGAATEAGSSALEAAPVFDQIHWLRDVLPLLGVRQVWNSLEEADDIIATMAHHAVGKRCIIISTDRDLLQLVTDTVHVLIPGKDKLFDPQAVEAEYGVKPEHMVDLRAIDGDSSDNIPGVFGFGLKTAAKLLRMYGTVDGVYASNLAGITALQYRRLRESEKQVRLNVQLMTLHRDLSMQVAEPNPDQIAATERLRDVDVKSEPVLAAMLGSAAVGS